MKTGTIAIILALIGILFVIWFNYQTAELYQAELIKMQSSAHLSPIIITTGKLNKLIAIGIGLLGLLLGIKSVRNNNPIGKIGVILSIMAIVLSFLPIWIYLN
jgi:hypothetical protein